MESNYQYWDYNLLVSVFFPRSLLSSLRIEIIKIKVRFSLRLLFYYGRRDIFSVVFILLLFYWGLKFIQRPVQNTHGCQSSIITILLWHFHSLQIKLSSLLQWKQTVPKHRILWRTCWEQKKNFYDNIIIRLHFFMMVEIIIWNET